MNIEKQSSKFIKPSVPTPPTFRHYKTGLIDELAPSLDVCIVLFFSANSDLNPKFVTNHQLEQSLAKTLAQFYPLAGRYVEEIYTVDCNDEGVEFIHAKVNIKLQDILATDLNAQFVDEFIPSKTSWAANANPLLAIQVTMFECGGVTLGVRTTHKIVDASTLCTFINEWAAMNRSEENDYDFTGLQGFNASLLFPGRCIQMVPVQSISDDDIYSKYIRKKFTFSESAISNMKAKAIHGHWSKVQLVSALIWKAFIAVDRANNNVRKSILIQLVNLRGKTASLIPKHSCGNLWVLCATEADINVETAKELVDLLTDSVKKTISNFSKVDHNSEQGQSMVLSSFSLPNIQESTNHVNTVSSWCKFPFYEADFGFGKPTWIDPRGAPVANTTCLMDQARGNGVDAYVLLEVKDVPCFEEALRVDSFFA